MNAKAGAAIQSRAPEPSVDRIEELAGRILKGDILLPKFQRDFVWEKTQILDLLDSIVKNYPVGSILLWRSREQLRSERSIADLEIAETQFDYPVNYLLDGQQRLSTICGALHWHGSDPKSRWNLAYDLRERRFFHLETLDNPPPHQMRLNRIPNPASYFLHAAGLDALGADAETLKANANELFTRFKDYKVATVTLHEMSIQAVAPIFERINSRGTALTIVDLMRAATWSEEFDLIDEITSITERLNDKDYGGIEKKTILRSISAAAGGGFSESSIDNLRKHDADRLKQAVKTTGEAYCRSVDFLCTDLHVPNDRLLPYANQLVVLSEAFRLIKNPTAVQLDELRRWFWRTAISGYFGGWNTGNMASDQDAVRKFAAGETPHIDTAAIAPGRAIWTSREFRSNVAHAKILILLLSFSRPIDLLTGQKIDTAGALSQSNNKEFHHFFPKDYLKNSKKVSPRRANVLANFIMLTAASNKLITNRAPSDYLKQVEEALSGRLEEALSSNLISETAFRAALSDDYEGFLDARSATIDEKVKTLTNW